MVVPTVLWTVRKLAARRRDPKNALPLGGSLCLVSQRRPRGRGIADMLVRNSFRVRNEECLRQRGLVIVLVEKAKNPP